MTEGITFEELCNDRNRNNLLLNGEYFIKQIPPSQKDVAKKYPRVFDESKKFYKMVPRPNPTSISREYAYYSHCIQQVCVDGLWAEFGVYNGVSSQYLTSLKKQLHPNVDELFHGFDSFEGLPEEWHGSQTSKGGLSANGSIPEIEGAVFHKGWFKDTIPEFIKSYDKPCAFLHIDCDIYSSTVDILENLSHKIVPGTVILFDEFTGYDAWALHEYKAFMEFAEKYNAEYKWIACVVNAGQAACVITKIGEKNETK